MRRRGVGLVVAVMLVAAACSGDTADTSSTTSTSTTAVPPTSSTTTTTVASTTSAPSTTTTTEPRPLSATEVFDAVSPSVGFVETPIGSGTAVMVADGVAVTNAHVVWPYTSVRIVFPDGTEVLDAEVIAMDLMADGALIDVGADAPAPVSVVDGSGLPAGSALFLIGYPLEGEAFPEPTIASGILSRLRSWEAGGLDYIQSDAVIDPGQSGGALVDERGSVVGVTGFGFGGFALAVSAPQLVQRLNRIEAGIDVTGTERPLVPAFGGDFEVSGEIPSIDDSLQWVFEAGPGSAIEVSVTADADIVAVVLDPIGDILEIDDAETPVKELRGAPYVAGPHWLVITPIGDGPVSVDVSANVSLRGFEDPDEGPIGLGTFSGRLDYGADVDSYRLATDPGAAYRIRVESMYIDPLVDVFEGEGYLGGDDDFGGGIFGLDAEVDVVATTEEVVVQVTSARFPDNGDYIVSVEEVGVGLEFIDIGTCFDDQDDGGGLWVAPVDCDEPHDNEFFSQSQFPSDLDADFPGDTVLVEFAERVCLPSLAAYVEGDPMRTALDFWYFYPSPETWVEGDRAIQCMAYLPAGQLVGTVAAESGA